jgi:preprotein translocase subunit SecG
MGFSVFLVLITIVCFLLILVIMVQNPKGGGLSSTLGGGSQIGGVQKTTDFLDKSTWTLGIVLIVLILLSSISEFGNAETITIDKGTVAPMKTTEIQNPVTAPAATTPDATVPAEATTPATTEEKK